MSDLVKRLRDQAKFFMAYYTPMDEAADRIEELEDENKRLLANAKTDAEFLLVYHQWCFKHGCAPSSSDLIAVTVGKIGTAMFLVGCLLMLVGIGVKIWEVMP